MKDFKIKDGILKKYIGKDEVVVIPDGVTRVEGRAFVCNTVIKSVTVPDSVVSIRCSAFGSCSALTHVDLPNNITSIDSFVFFGCHSLKAVVIPNNVQVIGDHSFHDCYALSNVVIPDSVSSIGCLAFENCRSLVSITIPNKIEFIDDNAFGRCDSLMEMFIPVGKLSLLKKLGKHVIRAAFRGCLIEYADKIATEEDQGAFSEFIKPYLDVLGDLIIDNIRNIELVTCAKMITRGVGRDILDRCASVECKVALLNYINGSGCVDFNKFKL